jgi:hypothetical protein
MRDGEVFPALLQKEARLDRSRSGLHLGKRVSCMASLLESILRMVVFYISFCLEQFGKLEHAPVCNSLAVPTLFQVKKLFGTHSEHLSL